jgi:teichuronic acid biosynthesis glycosyltransferase TuaC
LNASFAQNIGGRLGRAPRPVGSTWEIRDPYADVMFVTNMWPDEERPVYGIFVQRQVESLRASGLRCDVLYVRGYRGMRSYVSAFAWFVIHRKALAARYSLIHAHAGESALVICGGIGIRKMASYCGDDILGQARPDGSLSRVAVGRRWLIAQSARSCALTITKSAEMERALPSSIQGRNSVLPNGIDEKEFFPHDYASARRRLGWDMQEFVVIFVATRPHEPRKRLDLAEAAVAEAERALGPIRLYVAENVSPTELPIIMSAGDCMLLTSRMEGSPNAVKEALMCDLPVISTDVGDVAELLEDVSQSQVCRDTPAELGLALAKTLKAGLRSDGREKSANLKQTVIADRLLSLYERIGYQRPEHPDVCDAVRPMESI